MPALLRRLADRARWEYREWRTPSAPSFIQEELDRALLDEIPWRSGERLLDVGCGPGRYLRAFAERGLDPVGLDLSLEALRQARARHPDRVLAASGDRLPFADASFDAVVCHKTLHLFPTPLRVADEFVRVVRPGGRIVFSTSNPASPYARISTAVLRRLRAPNWGRANRWSVAEWRRAFEQRGLRLAAIYSCNLVWPLVFRIGDLWLLPNEWMRRYNRCVRRAVGLPLRTPRPCGAAMDYVIELRK